MALHHTQIKKLAAAGMDYTIENGTLSITMDGVVLASGPEANAKAIVAEAINKAEDEDFDLEALRDEQAEDGQDEQEEEQEEGEDSPLARTIAKYRNKYKEIGANDSNGDALALALRAHITRQGEKSKDTSADLRALRDVLDQNGLPIPRDGRNTGHTRMIYGNVLRGRWNKGYAIHVGATVIEPTPEGLARKAAAMAKDEAKANAAPRAKQSEDERKAKAKARRQAKAAERKAAQEPEAEATA